MALAVVPSDMVPREPTGGGSGGGGSTSQLGVVSTGPLPKMRPGDPDTVAEPPTGILLGPEFIITERVGPGGLVPGPDGSGGGNGAPGGCRDCEGGTEAPSGGSGDGGVSGNGGTGNGAETATSNGEPARPPWPLLLLLSVVLGGIVST